MIESGQMTSDFIYSPHFKTQCVSLNAQAAAVPRGTIVCVKSTADGTFDIVGSTNYGVLYGVLLEDVPVSTSAQSVQLIVAGELFKSYMDGVYKAAHSGTALSAAQLVELRKLGIILK